MILDGGDCDRGIESTIVQCLPGEARILRPGSIGASEIAAACGLAVREAGSDAEGPRASGRLAGHYAPRLPLELVREQDLSVRLAELGDVPVAALVPEGYAPGLPSSVLRFSAPHTDAAAFAHVLYERLRRMDASGAKRLVVVVPPEGEAWNAVRDRLSRAEAGSRARSAGSPP
jgi:L-threonylcarbamoyladenylate synthase